MAALAEHHLSGGFGYAFKLGGMVTEKKVWHIAMPVEKLDLAEFVTA